LPRFTLILSYQPKQIFTVKPWLSLLGFAQFTVRFLPVYIEAGFIYWMFCWVLFYTQARLEKHFGRHVAR